MGSNAAMSVSTIIATTSQMMILTQRSLEFAIGSARADDAAVLYDPNPDVITRSDHRRIDPTGPSEPQGEPDRDDSQTNDGLVGRTGGTGPRRCPTESDERPS